MTEYQTHAALVESLEAEVSRLHAEREACARGRVKPATWETTAATTAAYLGLAPLESLTN